MYKRQVLNMIAGVYPVDSGSIMIDDIDVTKLPEHKRAKYLGRVFPVSYTHLDVYKRQAQRRPKKHSAKQHFRL